METKRRDFSRLSCIAVLALAGASCQGKHNEVNVQNEESAGSGMVSVVRMNDPKASEQLLSGFYSVENNAWRWTSGKFSVILRTPAAASQQGATLSLAFTIPDVVIQKVKSITITASASGTELKSAKYDTPGSYVFNADVPASMLSTESVKVDFALDNSFRLGEDKRELGIVAASVSIAPK